MKHKNLSLPTQFSIALLRLYQISLSPILYFLGVRCRHAPTCSHYAIDAYRKHGAWRGFWLTLARLLRCHPFGSHGFDPVPDDIGEHPWQPWKYGDWSWRERQ